MLNPIDIFGNQNRSQSSFWLRVVNDEQLQNCDNLEKLLAGCELIAALDDPDLLAA